MYFTRDPVIETIITARDGHKLVLRNTKIASQEPFIVDSVEVVSLSGGCFFRNSERSQSFFVPISDYDVIEVKDARTTLKLPGVEKGIKIAGGRGTNLKSIKEIKNSTIDSIEEKTSVEVSLQDVDLKVLKEDKKEEKENWKKNKKRKSNRNSLSSNFSKETSFSEDQVSCSEDPSHIQVSNGDLDNKVKRFSLLPPPPMLISEVMSKFSEASLENQLENQSNDTAMEDISFVVEE